MLLLCYGRTLLSGSNALIMFAANPIKDMETRNLRVPKRVGLYILIGSKTLCPSARVYVCCRVTKPLNHS